jgi:lysophospholipase L1-like esterase
MREKLIKVIASSRVISYGSLVLLTFIVAMKHPLKDQPTPPAKHYNYLALGDSYTIGEKVKFTENFPSQVTSILKDKGFDFGDPEIIARTGWTTNDLQAALHKAKLPDHYDFVTLLIGVNNQYRGKKAAEYAPEFESLLKQAVQYASQDSSHVIILSIPDWSVTPFGEASLPDAQGRDRKKIATQIDEYNTTNQQIAAKYKVHYIDVTKSTREVEKDPSLVTSDGLHPSAKEYSKWAKGIAEFIQTKL